MKKLFVGILMLVMLVGFGGCTSIKVKPLRMDNIESVICIQKNPKVKHEFFVRDMIKEFSYYGIEVKSFEMVNKTFIDEKPEYPKEVIEKCDLILKYVANWTWDMGMYCWRIDIKLYDRNNIEVANGLFELVGEGGLALNKWRSTKSKIRELLVEFMCDYCLVIEPPPIKVNKHSNEPG